MRRTVHPAIFSPDSHGAGERNAIHQRVIYQRLACARAGSHHEVECAVWQAGTRDDLCQRPGRTWREFGRLVDHAVAIRERRCDFPGRDAKLEIPRCHQADHAKRLACYLDFQSGTQRTQCLSGIAHGLASIEPKDLRSAQCFARALGQGLPFFS